MATWFTSINGALILSVFSLMSFVGRSFLDARYVLPEDMPDASKTMVGAWALFTAILVGGWSWALLGTAGGTQGGLIALFVLCGLNGLLGGAASLIAFRPIMPTAAPMGQIAIWTSLITGVLAALSIGMRLWGAG